MDDSGLSVSTPRHVCQCQCSALIADLRKELKGDLRILKDDMDQIEHGMQVVKAEIQIMKNDLKSTEMNTTMGLQNLESGIVEQVETMNAHLNSVRIAAAKSQTAKECCLRYV
ncbi:hypothetical protein EUX98_g5414 [Antrodiella citrinella]|uniref:Uncharacterized protein n=1 Tax=Antrodiella citrinella TaxID=2447956 RepID=A0A4S4MTI5_9APHY|nr:hypothetical protein EUX98_g5414 [Antrodiella citrinella]